MKHISKILQKMKADMQIVENLLKKEGISLKSNSNTLLVDSNVEHGIGTWGKLDALKSIGYNYETI